MASATRQSLVVAWPARTNEHGAPMLWFAAWLVGDHGAEGQWFYNARGGDQTVLSPPPEARGMRVYRWPNEGLDPEYCDVFLDAEARIDVAALDFDRPQPFSRLRVGPDD